MRKWKEAAALLLAVCIFIGTSYGTAALLLPARENYGATWGKYLQEERNSLDILYLGSSVVYCGVVPAVVWAESGLTSYVMAGPTQTMPITYHYLRQACKTQSPQAVVIELNGLFLPQYSQHMKPNLLYMPWGVDRVLAVFRGAAPEDRLEMLFPLYSDHDRIYSTDPKEIEKNRFPEKDAYAGYTLLTKVCPLSERSVPAFDADTDVYREGIRYLRDISSFCAKRDIALVLYFSPVSVHIPQSTLDTLEQDLAAIPHTLFFNCNDGSWPDSGSEAIWYDFRHLNLYGAVPFSRYLAQELDKLGLETRHGGFDALWQERYDLIIRQYEGDAAEA